MTIKDDLWLLAHSKNANDRRNWAVLYWKYQGLTHRQVGAKVGKSSDWVQNHMTAIYKYFKAPDIEDKEEKFQWLKDNVFPALKEFLEDNPDVLNELPPPQTDELPVITGEIEEDPEDTQPQKSLQRAKVIEIAPKPESRSRRWLPFLMLVLFGVILLSVGYLAYQWGRGSQTPSPNLEIEATETPTPTHTLTPTVPPLPDLPIAATMTDAPPTNTPTPFVPPADGILFQDDFENSYRGEWLPLNGNWITSNGRLSIAPDYGRFMWIRLDAPQWKNYIVQANINRTFGQVLLAVRDQSLAYKIGFYGHNCWAYIEQGFDPPCITTMPNNVDRIIDLQLEVNNDEFIARVNGVEIQRITIATKENGGIAFAVWCQAQFECPSIDDVKVTYLP